MTSTILLTLSTGPRGRWGGGLQGDRRTPLTRTRQILLYILTKPEKTADICPGLSYKNVCFLNRLLYHSLWLYHKTKLNSARQPPTCRHTWPHMAGGLAPSHLGLLQRTQRSLPSSSPGPSTLSLVSTYLICLGSLLLSPPFHSWVEVRASRLSALSSASSVLP